MSRGMSGSPLSECYCPGEICPDTRQQSSINLIQRHADDILINNKNLAIANRSRVSCAHNTSRAFIDLNITP